MKHSLRKKILQYLTGRNWVHSGELEKRAIEWGYKAETCGRQCRKLAQWGIIEKKVEKCVWYRELPIPIKEPIFGQLQCV